MRFKESYLSREYHVKMQVKTSLAFVVWRFVLSEINFCICKILYQLINVQFMSQVTNFSENHEFKNSMQLCYQIKYPCSHCAFL